MRSTDPDIATKRSPDHFDCMCGHAAELHYGNQWTFEDIAPPTPTANTPTLCSVSTCPCRAYTRKAHGEWRSSNYEQRWVPAEVLPEVDAIIDRAERNRPR